MLLEKCDAYHTRKKIQYVKFCPVIDHIPEEVEVSECWGTKEREECNCGGDKTKCSFYKEVREKAISNNNSDCALTTLQYCTYHPEDLAESMTDWLESILGKAGIVLKKEDILEQQKLLVDYFNTPINNNLKLT